QALLTEQDIKNQGNRINALVDFILFSQTNFLLMAGFAFIINTKRGVMVKHQQTLNSPDRSHEG
ncbi:hypothetical protein, partial [Shewanella sairae]